MMSEYKGIEVLFIAGFGPVVEDRKAAHKLYAETLGVVFKEEEGGYLHTEEVEGAKTFALWPLAHAAQSCFGSNKWPKHLPVPQAWLEFDVDDLIAATEQLKKLRYELLVENREEPWGQTVTRFLSPEGLLVGITHTPFLRKGGSKSKG